MNSGLSKADFADWARESAGMSGYRFYGSIRDTTFDVTILRTPPVVLPYVASSTTYPEITADSVNYSRAIPTGTDLIDYAGGNQNLAFTFSKPTTVDLYWVYFRAPYTYSFSVTPTVVSGLTYCPLVGSAITCTSYGNGILNFQA